MGTQESSLSSFHVHGSSSWVWRLSTKEEDFNWLYLVVLPRLGTRRATKRHPSLTGLFTALDRA